MLVARTNSSWWVSFPFPFLQTVMLLTAGSFPKPRLSAWFSHHGFILIRGRSRALQSDNLSGNLRGGVILAYGHLHLTISRSGGTGGLERKILGCHKAQSSAFELGLGVGQFFLVRHSPRHPRMLALLTSRHKLLAAIPALCQPKNAPRHHSQMSATEAVLPWVGGKWEVMFPVRVLSLLY